MSSIRDIYGPVFTPPTQPRRVNAKVSEPVETHSPICNLPPELLSKIFEHYNVLPDKSSPGIIKSTIFLSLVCKTWRMVAESTPALWNHIVVSFPQAPELDEPQDREEYWDYCDDLQDWMRKLTRFGSFLKKSVARSGSLPLYVYLGTKRREPHHLLDEDADRIFSNVFLPLLEVTDRWHGIFGNVDYNSATFSIFVSARHGDVFPELRRIELDIKMGSSKFNRRKASSWRGRSTGTIWHAPKLELIKCAHMPMFSRVLGILPAWSGLVELDSLLCTADQMALVLASCPLLAQATFRSPVLEDTPERESVLDGHLYELASLKSLSLTNLSIMAVNRVFANFRFPALETLAIHNWRCDHRPQKRCNLGHYEIVIKCAESLKSLTLDHACITKDHLQLYIERLNRNLESLTLDYTELERVPWPHRYDSGLFDNEVLKQIIPTADRSEGGDANIVFPRLRNLECYLPENGDDLGVDEGTLCQFIEAAKSAGNLRWLEFSGRVFTGDRKKVSQRLEFQKVVAKRCRITISALYAKPPNVSADEGSTAAATE
ncbi:hypothetical protein H1R20_g8690, partial [Candolleomyces eurysporus]